MTIRRSIGQISSLPIHMSAMKTSFTTTDEADVMFQNLAQHYSEQKLLQTKLGKRLNSRIRR
jgi:hypothetical protein